MEKELLEQIEESFKFVVRECLDNPEFMREYRRVFNTDFGSAIPPIYFEIDKATGAYEDKAKEFFDFVRDYVWKPWLDKLRSESPVE